jgi:hypothetical protein
MKLNVLQRIKVKQQARTAWLEASGDPDRAEQVFRSMQPAGISPELLSVLVAVALALFRLWIDTRQSTPSVVMTQEEADAVGMGEGD